MKAIITRAALAIAAIMLGSCGVPVTASFTYIFPDSGAKAGLSMTIPKARIVNATK